MKRVLLALAAAIPLGVLAALAVAVIPASLPAFVAEHSTLTIAAAALVGVASAFARGPALLLGGAALALGIICPVAGFSPFGLTFLNEDVSIVIAIMGVVLIVCSFISMKIADGD